MPRSRPRRTCSAAASAADIKLSATAIGRPPIFSNTFADVGEAMGYWKKAGLDVNFRWFQRGTDTAKAVVTGDARSAIPRRRRR